MNLQQLEDKYGAKVLGVGADPALGGFEHHITMTEVQLSQLLDDHLIKNSTDPAFYISEEGEIFHLPPAKLLSIPIEDLIASIGEPGEVVYRANAVNKDLSKGLTELKTAAEAFLQLKTALKLKEDVDKTAFVEGLRKMTEIISRLDSSAA